MRLFELVPDQHVPAVSVEVLLPVCGGPARGRGPSGLAFGGAIHAALEQHFNRLLDALAEAFWVAWRDRSEAASIRFASGEDLRSVATLARLLHAFQAGRLAQASVVFWPSKNRCGSRSFPTLPISWHASIC